MVNPDFKTTQIKTIYNAEILKLNYRNLHRNFLRHQTILFTCIISLRIEMIHNIKDITTNTNIVLLILLLISLILLS